MQSSKDILSDDSIPNHHSSPTKRKHGKSTGSKDTRETSPSKRLKTSHTSGNLGWSVDMSKTMRIGAKPAMIDLTRAVSNFQPHAGAKRLVIKNLRTTSRKDVDEYYERTWQELDAALTCLFDRRSLSTPLEVLCRGVEATCRRGRADELYRHLRDRCKSYLEKRLLPGIQKQAAGTSIEALQTVYKQWTIWNEQAVLHSCLLLLCELWLILLLTDNYTIHIQLSRPILPLERERCCPTRRP